MGSLEDHGWKDKFAACCENDLDGLRNNNRAMYKQTSELEWIDHDSALEHWRSTRSNPAILGVCFEEQYSLPLCLERYCSKIDHFLDEYDSPNAASSSESAGGCELGYFHRWEHKWGKHFQEWDNIMNCLSLKIEGQVRILAHIERKIKSIATITGNFSLVDVMEEALNDASGIWSEGIHEIRRGIQQRRNALVDLPKHAEQKFLKSNITRNTHTIKALRESLRARLPEAQQRIRRRKITKPQSPPTTQTQSSGKAPLQQPPRSYALPKKILGADFRTHILTFLMVTFFIASSSLIKLALVRRSNTFASLSHTLLVILQAGLSMIQAHSASKAGKISWAPIHFAICIWLGTFCSIVSTAACYKPSGNWSTLLDFFVNVCQATSTIVIAKNAGSHLEGNMKLPGP